MNFKFKITIDNESFNAEKSLATQREALAFAQELGGRLCKDDTLVHIGVFMADEHGDYGDDLCEVDEGTGNWRYIGHRQYPSM